MDNNHSNRRNKTVNDIEGETQPNDQELKSDIEKKLTKQIAKGGSITFFGTAFGKGLKFLFQILLTRILGASTYGLYTLGYSVLGISQTISKLGLHNGVLRFGSRYRGVEEKSKLKGVLIASLVLSFLAGTIISILLYSFSDFVAIAVFSKPALSNITRVFSISLPFFTVLAVIGHSFRVFRRMEYNVGVQFVLHPLLLIISAIVVFVLGYRILGVTYGFLLSTIISVIVGLALLWKLFPDLISELSPSFELKKLIYFSMTVLLLGISSILLSKTDRIMLGTLRSAEGVGVYNAAAVMAAQASVFLGSFNAIFTPIISDLYNREKLERLGSLFKTVTKWIFSITLPLFCILAIFSNKLMGLFGPGFVPGWNTLIVLGFSKLLGASVGSVGFMLIMTDHEKLELINSLVMGSLNVVLNFLLIRRYGVLGAAFATSISLGVINIARLFEVYTLLGIQPYKKSYWKPLASGLLSLFVVLVLKYMGLFEWKLLWLTGVIIFMTIYFGLLVVFGLDGEDRLVLKAAKKKFFSNM